MTKIDIGRHEEQRRVVTPDTAEDPANPVKPDTSAEQVKEEQVKEQTSDIALTMGSAKEADSAGKKSPVDNEDWVGTAVLGYLTLSRAIGINITKQDQTVWLHKNAASRRAKKATPK